MGKFSVTPELAEIIKTTRIQNNVTAKDIAKHIGKSQAYMSKLEKAEIKTIEESNLTEIFRFIYGKEEGFQDFLEKTIGRFVDSNDEEEINKQIWLYNYDTILRRIPIPEELVDELNKKISDLNVSVEKLVFRINANESLAKEIIDDSTFPYNEWILYSMTGTGHYQSYIIKMKVEISQIKAILDKQDKKCNYITMLAIVFYLHKMEKYGDITEISDEEESALSTSATDFLNRFKFFSIAEKNKLRKQMEIKAEQDSLLSEFDKANSRLLNQMLYEFKLISEIDIMKTNEYLQKFVKNLEWDGGFMMTLISLDFNFLNDMSFSAKKRLLMEIKEVVKRYLELPDEKKKIEMYD